MKVRLLTPGLYHGAEGIPFPIEVEAVNPDGRGHLYAVLGADLIAAGGDPEQWDPENRYNFAAIEGMPFVGTCELVEE